MSVKNILKPIAMQSVNSAGLGGAGVYTNLSLVTGLGFPCVILRLINASNTACTISFDGVTDHDYLAANSSIIYPAQSVNQPQNYTAIFGASQVVYVAGAAGVGFIYVVGYYQPGS